MKYNLLQALVGTVLMLTAVPGCTAKGNDCVDTGPPSIWVVKSPYPFQAGSERSFDELYHGPWRARVEISLYSRPRSGLVIGKVKRGTVVRALLGETIVVHPLRLIAAQDFQVVENSAGRKIQFATMHKGDVFWVLDSGNEGEFAIRWHCRVVGWDSTAASEGDLNQLQNLGANQELWVKVRDRKTGLSGWFHDVPVHDGPKLIPAHATTKSTG